MAIHPPGPSLYYWIRSEKFPDRQSGSFHRIVSNLESLSTLPIAVSFSKVGNRNLIPLQNLLLPNPYFVGRFDQITGRLIITATRDLGTIAFRELEGFAKDETEFKQEPLDIDTVVEVKDRPIRSRVNMGKPVVLRHDGTAITVQKVVLLNITRPEVIEEDRAASPARAYSAPLTLQPSLTEEHKGPN